MCVRWLKKRCERVIRSGFSGQASHGADLGLRRGGRLRCGHTDVEGLSQQTLEHVEGDGTASF